MRILITSVLSVVIHLVFGWAWTLVAGILGGALASKRGWLVGMVGVGSGWAACLVYSYAVAPEPTATMLGALSRLAGNIPGAVLVLASLLIGLALGLFGGVIGTQLSGLKAGDA